MKKLLSTTAVILVLAAPAFASPLIGNDSHDTNYSQGQNQSATGVGIGKGGSASSKAPSGSYSSAGAVNTTKSVNSNTAVQGQSADNNGNSYAGDSNDVEVYAVSYTDTQPQAPQAAIGNGVVVTTWGVKVLGPVFGMTDQHVHYTPSAIGDAAELSVKATTNDGTYAGEQKQFAYVAAICAHDEALAEQLNFGCK